MLIVFALCGAYAVYCLAANPAGPITTPDSFHYLNMTPIVPLGYPLFLKLTGARGALIVQPIIFSAALVFLGREIIRATRSRGLAATIVFGSMIVPQIRGYHASILSESLFLTLLVIFLALSVRFMHQPTWRLMIVVAITVGAAATIRRTGFAFVPVMLVMGVLADLGKDSADKSSGQAASRPAQVWLFLVAALAPFAVIAATEQVIAPIIHDGAASSLLGRHMFAKAALIDAPPHRGNPAEDKVEDPVRRALDDQLEHAFAPIRRMLAEAPGNVRGVLTIYYETCLQGGCADRARAATGEPNEARQTQVMGAAGIARIRRAPLNFLQLTRRHYASLWTYDRLRHPQTAAELNAFLATHRPLPYEELAMSLGPDRSLEFSGSPHVRYAQYGLRAIAVITGMLAVLGGVAAISSLRLPPALAAACVAALTAHGALMLTALLAAGFTRFLLGVWPALVVAMGLAAWSLWLLRADVRPSLP